MNPALIEHYVSGKLGAKEAEEFEAYCVANPEFAKQVEFEQRLRAGIVEVAKGSTEEFVRSSSVTYWKFAAAASVLLAIGALAFALWWPGGLHGRVLLAAVTTDAERNGPSLRLAQVRGVDDVPKLQSGVMRVEIVGLFDTAAHYSVTLDHIEPDGPAESLSTLYRQHPSSPVTLEFMLDSGRLQAGPYALRIRKQSSDEDSLDFVVVKP
jgi:hypothetical protein